MKNFKTKFLVAILSFALGISAFHLSRNIYPFVASDTSEVITPNFTSYAKTTTSPAKELSGKAEIHFVRFVQSEGQIEAEFELTNNSTENIYYYSYSKESYPFPTLKRDGKVVTDKRFRCGSGIEEQTLSTGESVFYRISKWEVTYEPTQKSWKESDKPTQIGFPFVIGNERRKETLWTEAIKFPR